MLLTEVSHYIQKRIHACGRQSHQNGDLLLQWDT